MATLRASRIIELVSSTQSYDWGKPASTSLVAAFSHPSSPPSPSKPYAELWMGTHPSAPSRVLANNKPLQSYLETHPALIGKSVSDKFDAQKGDLPFLFKVLSIAKALSIQAHPDKALGKKLHKERPDVYKDPNHKPEMAVALTPFSGFCGFRPLGEIVDFLSDVPEFAALIPEEHQTALKEAVEAAGKEASSVYDEKNGKESEACKNALKDIFEDVMAAKESIVKSELEKLIKRVKGGGKSEKKGEWEELVVRLDEQYPGGDVGVFCTFLLNVVELKKGEAMFLMANEPHAYLEGDIMECMATSDNVIRAGLTPKLRDVPTLISMLTYRYGPSSSQLLSPTPFRSSNPSYTTLYDPPIAEFSVIQTCLPAGAEDTHEPIKGPSIVIVSEGAGKAEEDEEGVLKSKGPKIVVGKEGEDGEVDVNRDGQVWFVGEGTELRFKAGKEQTTFFRAFVEA